jgi:isopentenyl-diphosphate Delta-isomerase
MTGELLDIFDSSGHPQHRAKPRFEAHHCGLWHRTVHVWIVNGTGMLLFQKRSLSKESFPGLWDVSAAGHVSAGEPLVAAARREVFQELGVRVADAELGFLFTTKTSSVQREGTFVDNEFNHVYAVRRDVSIGELTLQESEVADAQYVPCGELRRLAESGDPAFAPHPEEYARLHRYLCRL